MGIRSPPGDSDASRDSAVALSVGRESGSSLRFFQDFPGFAADFHVLLGTFRRRRLSGEIRPDSGGRTELMIAYTIFLPRALCQTRLAAQARLC